MADEPYTIDENAVWNSLPKLRPMGAGTHDEALQEDIGPTALPSKPTEKYDDNLIWDMAIGLLGTARAGVAGMVGSGVEAIHQLYQHITNNPEAPQSTEEAAKRIGTKGLTAAVGTKISEKAIKGVSGAVKHIFQRSETPSAQEAIGFTKEGMPYQGQPLAPPNEMPLTVAQRTDNQFYAALENIAEGGAGARRMATFKKTGQEYTENAFDNFLEAVGGHMTPHEIGTLVGKTLAGEREAVLAPLKAEYNNLGKTLEARQVRRMVLVKNEKGEMVPTPKMVLDPKSGAVVKMNSLKAFAKQMLNQTKHSMSGQTESLLKTILSKPDEITYNAAKELKTNLEDIGYQAYLTSNGRDQVVGMARKLANMVRGERQAAVNRYDKRAGQQLEDLDKAWSTQTNRVNTDYLRKLINLALDKNHGIPENIKQQIVTPQGISQLKRVKAVIGHTPVWGKLQASAMSGELEKSTDPKTKIINFATLEKRLFGRTPDSYETGLGKDVVETLYTPEQIHWLKKAITVGVQQQKKPITGVGKMAIQMQTAGAVMAIGGLASRGFFSGEQGFDYESAGKGALFGAGLVLISPALLAQIMTKPHLAQYLVKGMQTSSTSPYAGPILRHLMAGITRLAASTSVRSHQHPTSVESIPPPHLTNRSLPSGPPQQGF